MTTLTDLRKARMIQQTEVARALGVDKRSVYYWEHGYTRPSLPHARALAEVYGVGYDVLQAAIDAIPLKDKQKGKQHN